MAWTRRLSSGKFQGLYRDAYGKERSAGTFPRERQALSKAAAAEEDARINPRSPEARTITWAQWEPRWLARRSVAPQSLKADMSKIEHHVRPKWGDVPLADITQGDIQEWVNELRRSGGVRTTSRYEAGRPLSASTVTKCYRLLSSSMRAAVTAKVLDKSPCFDVKISKDGVSPERYLTDDEQDAICAELDGQDLVLVRLAFGTGLRLGEIIGLHWESIDLDGKTLHVRHAYDPEDRSMKAPKSYAMRAVPIPDEVVALLEEHRTDSTPALQCPIVHNGSTKCRTGLVFTQADGKPIDGHNFRHRRWERACRRAAVRDSQGRDIPVGHARVHDTRHTYASTLIRAGIHLAQVCTLMGHSSIVVTMRYSHLGNSQWGAVAEALNRRTAGRTAKPELRVVKHW
ncbi:MULTISPECIES: site-specific integrase [unclassified Rhodococcus (in: high G+C Gram-positive bacteria)]|uniref:tyrosine-type recombinase/integrase n=1 Tax=unclassified Rhodococcus (in: high G+C Gram-positive bacteria) TaxID=192944 RepID=UPI000B9C703F|nr:MULTISPECIES: site-specific integrase [unclassified Rhodococcus (in: high G+C Gram-positive bacteria)]OZE35675.1 hypothetical protein CH259_16770 [Rhodococcus sp. 05-2254-4]OZE48104.1 hypothetical protein CH261_09365 [Rhodococcus sp. 05-2254-3]OZE49315.1 hypothetical protein CH283_17150 [Rhodococcus sp. 05-2254-2]